MQLAVDAANPSAECVPVLADAPDVSSRRRRARRPLTAARQWDARNRAGEHVLPRDQYLPALHCEGQLASVGQTAIVPGGAAQYLGRLVRSQPRMVQDLFLLAQAPFQRVSDQGREDCRQVLGGGVIEMDGVGRHSDGLARVRDCAGNR